MELQKLGSMASVAGDVYLPKRYPALPDEEVRRRKFNCSILISAC